MTATAVRVQGWNGADGGATLHPALRGATMERDARPVPDPTSIATFCSASVRVVGYRAPVPRRDNDVPPPSVSMERVT